MVKTAGHSDSLSPTVTAPVPDSTDLDAPIFKVNAQHRPLGQGVINGQSHQALRKVVFGGFQPDQGTVDALMDWDALMGADNTPELGAHPTFPQPGFDFIEVLDL